RLRWWATRARDVVGHVSHFRPTPQMRTPIWLANTSEMGESINIAGCLSTRNLWRRSLRCYRGRGGRGDVDRPPGRDSWAALARQSENLRRNLFVLAVLAMPNSAARTWTQALAEDRALRLAEESDERFG